jgi:hypothetical protein
LHNLEVFIVHSEWPLKCDPNGKVSFNLATAESSCEVIYIHLPQMRSQKLEVAELVFLSKQWQQKVKLMGVE